MKNLAESCHRTRKGGGIFQKFDLPPRAAQIHASLLESYPIYKLRGSNCSKTFTLQNSVQGDRSEQHGMSTALIVQSNTKEIIVDHLTVGAVPAPSSSRMQKGLKISPVQKRNILVMSPLQGSRNHQTENTDKRLANTFSSNLTRDHITRTTTRAASLHREQKALSESLLFGI